MAETTTTKEIKMRLTVLLATLVLLLVAAGHSTPRKNVTSWYDLAGVDKAFVKKEVQVISKMLEGGSE